MRCAAREAGAGEEGRSESRGGRRNSGEVRARGPGVGGEGAGPAHRLREETRQAARQGQAEVRRRRRGRRAGDRGGWRRGLRLREGAGGGPPWRAGASKGGPAGVPPHSFISIAINNPFPRSCPDSN